MQPNVTRLIITLVVLAVIIGGGAIFVKIYPDLLWFDMIGYLAIYKKVLLTKIGLGVVVVGFFLGVTLINLYLLYRFTPPRLSPTLVESIPLEGMPDFNLRKAVYVVLTLLAIGGSLVGGYASTDYWEQFLRYSNASDLSFQSATSLSAPADSDATEVLISELEYSAKGFRIGDEVTVAEGDSSHAAQIRTISPGGGWECQNWIKPRT